MVGTYDGEAARQRLKQNRRSKIFEARDHEDVTAAHRLKRSFPAQIAGPSATAVDAEALRETSPFGSARTFAENANFPIRVGRKLGQCVQQERKPLARQMRTAPADSQILSRFSASIVICRGRRRADFTNHVAFLAVPAFNFALDSAGRRDDRAARLGERLLRFAEQELVQSVDHVAASVVDRTAYAHRGQQPPRRVLESAARTPDERNLHFPKWPPHPDPNVSDDVHETES